MEQVTLWTKIGSATAGYLLKQYDFDVNAKDAEGYTPLLKVVKPLGKPVKPNFNLRSGFGISEHINTLLKCGADRSITVLVDNEPKDAIQICSHPGISKILEQSV